MEATIRNNAFCPPFVEERLEATVTAGGRPGRRPHHAAINKEMTT